MSFAKRFHLVFEEDTKDTDAVEDTAVDTEAPFGEVDAQATADLESVETTEVDGEVVYPDLSDTETDEASKKMQDVHDEAIEVAEQAVNDTNTLAVAMESLHQCNVLGKTSPRQLESMRSLILDIRTRHGFQNPSAGLNLENYHGDKDNFSLVMESFASTLRSFWQALVAMITRVFSMIKRFLMELFSRTKHEREKAKAISQAILDQRRRFGKEIDLVAPFESMEEFVSMPLAARVLSVEGEQPQSYAQAFEHLMSLAPKGKTYEMTFGENFIKLLPDILSKLTAGEPLAASDQAVCPSTQSFNTFAMVNSLPGLADVPGIVYLVYKPFLGDFTVAQAVMTRAPVDPLDSYAILSNWKTHILQPGHDVKTTMMRNLRNNELIDATKRATELADSVTEYKQNFSAIEKIEKELQNSIKLFTSKAEELASSNPVATTSINTVSGAITAVMRNVEFALREYPRRSHGILFAWNNYLQAIYLKEKEIISKFNETEPPSKPSKP